MATTAADVHRTQKRRQHRVTPAPLPTDMVLEIARRTDTSTLARLAAACKDLRRHITDPSFRSRRLGLRHGERFAPPSCLLRGQLVCRWDKDLYLEDNTTPAAANGAKSVVATGLFNSADDELCLPVAARGGLVLVRVINPKNHVIGAETTVRVCSAATGRSQSLAPGPAFPGHHVLLAGDGANGGGEVGRPFKVLKVGSTTSALQIQTFSSERGTWGPKTMIPSPFQTSCNSLSPKPGAYLVVGDAVYWLCRDDNSFYVFKLDISGEARLTMTKLPPSFHRECGLPRGRSVPHVLLATAWAAGSPVVLVANHGRISTWTMTTSGQTARWTDKPHVVVEYEAMERLIDGVLDRQLGTVRLEWFAEMTGVVLLSTPRYGFFLLDLQSGNIIRHYSRSLGLRTYPYEMDYLSF
ncbi:unnamed protein product [Urochloa decumbens]|uniref:DUF7595 domain-containing protein n=1 Tax=Urochloa decumbens TaxID=240449 RepID=A0ABC8W6J5_9POAL